jgi:hypothetical protein
MKKQIVSLLLLLALGSCIDQPAEQSMIAAITTNVDRDTIINEAAGMLREGDLVVRLGRDPTSQFIKNFNRVDPSYSHAGIVMVENGVPVIYHVVNGAVNTNEDFRKDSLGGFCNPRNNKAFAIFRYRLSEDEIAALKKLLFQWYKKRIGFDYGLDLATNERMYCSEMVKKAIEKATNGRIILSTTPLSQTEIEKMSRHSSLALNSAGTLNMVAIDNLYENQFCYPVMKYRF